LLLVLFLVVHRPILDASESIQSIVSEIEESYQPYLQAKATWKVGDSHRTTLIRDHDKGKYADYDAGKTTSDNPDPESRGMHVEIIATNGTTYQEVVHVTETDVYRVRSRRKVDKEGFLADFGSTPPSPTFGILLGKWIPDLLNDLQEVSLSEVMLQDRQVQLLEGDLPGTGKLSIWFDPANKTVRKIDSVIEQPPPTNFSWENVSETTKASIPKRVIHQTCTMEEFSLVGSIPVPHKVVSEFTYSGYPNTLPKSDKDGKAILDIDETGKVRLMPGGHDETVSILEDIQFGRPSGQDLAITIPVPNETPVSMEDARDIEFVWRDGRIVQVTSEALQALRNVQFLSERSSLKFWSATLAVILLLILVLVFKIHRTRRT